MHTVWTYSSYKGIEQLEFVSAHQVHAELRTGSERKSAGTGPGAMSAANAVTHCIAKEMMPLHVHSGPTAINIVISSYIVILPLYK